jgi:hypothetical protein
VGVEERTRGVAGPIACDDLRHSPKPPACECFIELLGTGVDLARRARARYEQVLGAIRLMTAMKNPGDTEGRS